MGPGTSGSGLPSRPRFSWDTRNVPWTDGRGSQDQYAAAVSLWQSFHDKLPDANSNKIPEELRGIMLKSQLYGRTRDVCKPIPDDVIMSVDGASAIVKELYQRDPLAVVSEVYNDFVTLLNIKRGNNETFQNYSTRFQAQVSKFSAHCPSVTLHDSLTAFMLLANAGVDNTKRISVLAASAQKITTPADMATTATYLNAVDYTAIASVLRQCDQSPQATATTANALQVNAVQNTAQTPKPQNKRHKRKLTPAELADLKSRSQCRRRSKFGHWIVDHNPDGSLKPCVKASGEPASSSASGSNKKTVTFHMAKLSSDTECLIPLSEIVGPLLDDAAPYSGMGLDEFKMLQPIICPNWNQSFEPIPPSIAETPFWQYGSGNHSSEARPILGSIMITARSVVMLTSSIL